MTLKAFIDFAAERLSVLYELQEAKAVAVRLLKEVLAGYKGYEHLVEPGRALESFSLCEGISCSGGGVGEQSGAGESFPVGGVEDFEVGVVTDFLIGAVVRLSAGEPIQYILGYEWFCGHKFNVAPGVLIPRPETEELVKLVTDSDAATNNKGTRILDICTGSGCIAWSVAAGLPEAKVFGCDISKEALRIARGQGIPARANFFECDILSDDAQAVIAAACGEEKFSVIVSNPPYVCDSEKTLMQKNVLEFEPHLALFVPDSNPLKFYRRIAQLSGRLLEPGGMLFFEINERFGQQMLVMLREMGYRECVVINDIFGKERMAVAKN